MIKKTFIFFLLFISISLTFSNEPFKNNQKVKISGIIRLVGAEPFTRLTLRYYDTDFYLPDNMKKKFMPYLNRDVIAEGRVRIVVLESADHKYKVIEYHLDNVKIRKK